jgi:anaphase-promoting complex subunit 1
MWDDVRPTEAWLASQLPPPMQRPRAIAPAEPEDEEAVRLARVNSLAGACVALGLRFAGSCCKPACDLLVAQVKELHALRQACGSSGSSSRKAEQPTLEACLGAAAIAMAMVMAGSGNLDCFRLLRVLRRRVDAEVTYGSTWPT